LADRFTREVSAVLLCDFTSSPSRSGKRQRRKLNRGRVRWTAALVPGDVEGSTVVTGRSVGRSHLNLKRPADDLRIDHLEAVEIERGHGWHPPRGLLSSIVWSPKKLRRPSFSQRITTPFVESPISQVNGHRLIQVPGVVLPHPSHRNGKGWHLIHGSAAATSIKAPPGSLREKQRAPISEWSAISPTGIPAFDRRACSPASSFAGHCIAT
jgi:hypothetical protein